MRRILALVAALTLAALGAGASSAGTSTGCGVPEVEFRAYDGPNNGNGDLLGIACEFGTSGIGADDHFGDTQFAFRTTDNDKLDSWRFYNPTSKVWCLVLHEHIEYGGASVTYRLLHTSSWWGPSGGTVGSFSNKTSSVEFYSRNTGQAC
jgi:hypothetical protein